MRPSRARDLRSARPSLDEKASRGSASLTSEGGRKFGEVTAANIGRPLAIVLDGKVRSVARIDNRITTDGTIHGSFTQQEAQDLALILRSGALPAPLAFLAEGSISASLGADSIRQGVIASTVGLLLVVGFMLTYYRASGVNAAMPLIVNLVILLGLMAYVGVVMTLPGIAGFVLTMASASTPTCWCSNASAKSARPARARGPRSMRIQPRLSDAARHTHRGADFRRILFQFGTGPIRGFAVTFSIGLLSNLFTSTFVSKTLFEIALERAGQPTHALHPRAT